MIRSDCIDWLLSYAADEFHRQGIAETAGAGVHDQQANCPEVPGLRLEWDFATKAWLAEFVSGTCAGAKRRFGLTDLTEEHWASMTASGASDAGGDLKSADLHRRKAVAKELIMRLCVEPAVADSFTTPKKRSRLADGEED